MATLREYQDRVVELLGKAEPKENLKKWIIGNVPKHYKRNTLSEAEMYRIAEIGAKATYTKFRKKAFFTQSLMIGLAVEGKYRKVKVITSSQYGKSWTCGIIAIMRANEGREVYVAGGDMNTTTIIMKNVIDHLQVADYSITRKLIEFSDKIEKLQASVSKTKLMFKNLPKAGLIEGITLGISTKDAKAHNQAIGKGGDIIADEVDMIPSEVLAELGRSDFSSIGENTTFRMEISNPHNGYQFYQDMTSDEVDDDTVLIWMDARTAYEEGRIYSMDQVIRSDFYKNKSTCQRYLLCELEDFSDESMFSPMTIDNTNDIDDYHLFAGADSAYTGKDNIILSLTGRHKITGKLKAFDIAEIKKGEWIVGVTSFLIIDEIDSILRAWNVKMISVDIGFGAWLTEGLAKASNGAYKVAGIAFGSGTTKYREEADHFSAKYGFNLRAEMYIDLQQLIDSEMIVFTQKVYNAVIDQMNVTKILPREKKKLAIIPKDEIKAKLKDGKSPDETDGLVLSIHSVLDYCMTEGLYDYE